MVLVAACPMLQSMGPSETGSDLKIRLPEDIRADSVYTFLQYLYEGFTTLTDLNINEVEKIARLLQVDCLIKCCADFSKTLNMEVGIPMNSQSQYKYTSHDMFEFRHVRHSDLMKLSPSRNCKRPISGVISEQKRPRLEEVESIKSCVSVPSSQTDSEPESHNFRISLLPSHVTDDKISMAKTYNSSVHSQSQSSSLPVTSLGGDDCVIVENEPQTFEEGMELSERPSVENVQSSPTEATVQNAGSVGVFVSSQTNVEKTVQEVNMETPSIAMPTNNETDPSSSASSDVQRCTSAYTTKSSHTESKTSGSSDNCLEKKQTDRTTEDSSQICCQSEIDVSQTTDRKEESTAVHPGSIEAVQENQTNSHQSDDSQYSPLVESR